MKHKKWSPRRAAAFLLALLLAMPVVCADAGDRKLQTSIQIVDGLTYRNTVTANNGSRVESFALELSPDSSAQAILLQGDTTIYGTATINKAVSTAQAAGWHVLAAVNTDFFSMSTGVPIGIMVEDGIYRSCNDSENVLALTDGQAAILDAPSVTITIRDQNSGYSLTPHFFNKWRSPTGGIYLLNDQFSSVSTRTSGPGWYVRMKAQADPADGQVPGLTVNSTLTLQVTELVRSDQAIPIGRDEYILTADDQCGWGEVFEEFQVGDEVTLTTSCDDPTLSAARWACGAGDIMIQDGALTDSSDWTYSSDGRQPRTAVGIKADGTLVLYAVDGRQSNYSSGLSQKDLALELQAQGCVTAANLDGGGSTAMSVWLPGQSGAAVQSKPSSGSLRGCATYLLLVTDQKGSGSAKRLAPKEDGLTVLAGSSLILPQAVAIDEGLEPVSADLSDLTYTSVDGLGTIRNSLYTAGRTTGTDTVSLTAGGLEGSLQVHVVDQLTELTVRRAGSGSALGALTLDPREEVQLSVTGSWWGREALRDFGPVTVSVQGGIGVIDDSGLFIAGRTQGSGSITLSAGGLSKTIPVSVGSAHQDVTPDHWSYTAVEYCYSKGIVNGISSTLFGRDLPISRGDFIVMLHNAMGKPAASRLSTFDDVPQNAYYAPAIAWAQEVGLAAGSGDGTFAPLANISREQAFTLLYRFLPLAGKNCTDSSLAYLDQFYDRDSIADYAQVPAATLTSYGLASGGDGALLPKNTLTRAEMAALIYRLLELDPSAGKLEIPVSVERHRLALDRDQVTLDSGHSLTLQATLFPAKEGAAVTWSSSDLSAAAVTSNGMVTNLNPTDKARTVTVTAECDGLTAQCTVLCQPASRTGTVVDVDTGLNVRSGPGSTYSKVGALRNGAQVLVLSQEPGWYQILFLNPDRQAAIGYVSAQYLSVK